MMKSQRIMDASLVALGMWASLLGSASVLAGQPLRPLNILFIMVDDLRPELACYGAAKVRSPNIDRLAASGLQFDRAYCMVPVCGASRASLLSGMRPTATRFATYNSRLDQDAPHVAPMHEHFRVNGYETVSLGKVLHETKDCSEGWTQPIWRPRASDYAVSSNQRLYKQRRLLGGFSSGPAVEVADVSDNAYHDGLLAEYASQSLKRLRDGGRPFLLMVGFSKPHLPFSAPKRYWDLYHSGDFVPPANGLPPRNAPPQATHNWSELRNYANIPAQGPLSPQAASKLVQGYHACVSYVDAQIGRVLSELDRLSLTQDTIVVLWGDHGWHLGEHSLWCKHALYETTMRVPLIVRVPGLAAGDRSSALIESIDIYPTLCELAGLSLPDQLQGRSFKPLLDQPNLAWSDGAVGRYLGGETICSHTHRYTEYLDQGGAVVGRMLYDLRSDPGETVNLADDREFADVVQDLSSRLRATRDRD